MEPNTPPTPSVDVEQIMADIRRRLAAKKESGEYSADELERIDRYVLQIEAEGYNTPEEDIRHHLALLNYQFDTLRPPELASHRKRLGSLITGLKKALRRITEPYAQMLLKRQVEFNAETVRLLNQLVADYRFRVTALEQQLARQPEEERARQERWAEFAGRIADLTQETRAQKIAVEELLSGRTARTVAEAPSGPEAGADRLRAFEYLLFENRHRGAETEIQSRQRTYLAHFQQAGSVLDIGCGRGEFLELLQGAGIPARGVELNPEMVDRARGKGLDVVQGDGLEFLRNLADGELGGIFLSQVIEHLGPKILRELVRTAFLKLAPDGVLLAETVNPQCLTTFSGAFYVDLSHQNPIHPEAARFLWEMVGFRRVNILYVSPYPEEMRLKEMVRRDDESYADEIVRVLNEDVRQLNDLLYGYQDYAVVGYK
ncbi:MAG: methyltransferase domain-containing protein [Deltaproteobacteria bacterium]|nr:methyltransferase domain-containing protein [Deltaproteobacteria bacterium]